MTSVLFKQQKRPLCSANNKKQTAGPCRKKHTTTYTYHYSEQPLRKGFGSILTLFFKEYTEHKGGVGDIRCYNHPPHVQPSFDPIFCGKFSHLIEAGARRSVRSRGPSLDQMRKSIDQRTVTAKNDDQKSRKNRKKNSEKS